MNYTPKFLLQFLKLVTTYVNARLLMTLDEQFYFDMITYTCKGYYCSLPTYHNFFTDSAIWTIFFPVPLEFFEEGKKGGLNVQSA